MEVLNSRGNVDTSYLKEFDTPEHMEFFRKNEEVNTGLSHRAVLIEEVESSRLHDAYTSIDRPSNNLELSPTPFVFNEKTMTVVPSSDEPDDKTKFPKVWWKRKQYVSSTGRVYELGVEKPELRGTLPPTVE